MKGISTYGAVATKIRGMRSHLLSTEDYERMASAGSVKEIVTFLKSHPSYAPVLEDLDPDNMRREAFERMILRSVFRDHSKIAHFLNQKHKDLLTVFATQYELRLINNCIRMMYNKYLDRIDLSVYRPMYEGSPNFDFDKVIAADDIDSLIRALERSPYQEPIKKVRDQAENAELFDYETALNRFYFSYFWEAIRKIDSSEDRDVMMDIHGSEIDMLNLIWVYRAKAYYSVSGKEISGFLIPAYHKVKPRQIAEMVAANSPEEVLKLIAQTKYARVFDTSDPGGMETAYKAHITHLNAKVRREHPYSFAVIAAYSADKKEEVDRIVRITESVRYGYAPKLIMEVLNIQE